MKTQNFFLVIIVCAFLMTAGCSTSKPTANTPTSPSPTASRTDVPSALPDNAFKAALTVEDPPAKMRAGQKQTVKVKVKNASEVMWYARGSLVNTSPSNKFYLAVGDRWLLADGEKLVTDMDGRYGLPRDLKPGEEAEVPLAITAPKDPGDYILELDLVQEQVAWFHDKGSPMARVKIKIER